MTALLRMGVLAALISAAGPALAQPAPMRPPMNDFDQAFYRCDGGEAFMMTYDADEPTSAEMVTNSDQRHYKMKRADAKGGVERCSSAVSCSKRWAARPRPFLSAPLRSRR